MQTEKAKMLAGQLYDAGTPEIQADQAICQAWLQRYNSMPTAPAEQRHALLRERLGHVGHGAVIRPPLHCDYGYNPSMSLSPAHSGGGGAQE